jgi:hypothetical protein
MRGLRWKVYSQDGVFVGALCDATDAAVVVSLYGVGATIRDGANNRRVIYREGRDGCAGESADACAAKVYETAQKLFR